MKASDVVVVGAGVIGAACAYELAGAGLRVTVIRDWIVEGRSTGRPRCFCRIAWCHGRLASCTARRPHPIPSASFA